MMHTGSCWVRLQDEFKQSGNYGLSGLIQCVLCRRESFPHGAQTLDGARLASV